MTTLAERLQSGLDEVSRRRDWNGLVSSTQRVLGVGDERRSEDGFGSVHLVVTNEPSRKVEERWVPGPYESYAFFAESRELHHITNSPDGLNFVLERITDILPVYNTDGESLIITGEVDGRAHTLTIEPGKQPTLQSKEMGFPQAA